MTGKNPFSAPRVKRKPVKRPEPSFIQLETMRSSFAAYNQNNFCRWLVDVFGAAKAFELANLYNVGTSKYWAGACVFWQLTSTAGSEPERSYSTIRKPANVCGNRPIMYSGFMRC